jgi:hypothetical protein
MLIRKDIPPNFEIQICDNPFHHGYIISNSEPNATSKSLIMLTSSAASRIGFAHFGL